MDGFFGIVLLCWPQQQVTWSRLATSSASYLNVVGTNWSVRGWSKGWEQCSKLRELRLGMEARKESSQAGETLGPFRCSCCNAEGQSSLLTGSFKFPRNSSRLVSDDNLHRMKMNGIWSSVVGGNFFWLAQSTPTRNNWNWLCCVKLFNIWRLCSDVCTRRPSERVEDHHILEGWQSVDSSFLNLLSCIDTQVCRVGVLRISANSGCISSVAPPGFPAIPHCGRWRGHVAHAIREFLNDKFALKGYHAYTVKYF